MSEYLLFYKQRLPVAGNWGINWDIFISAYNSSDRVRTIADRVNARHKYWLMLPEYGYAEEDYPQGNVYAGLAENEAEYLMNFMQGLAPAFVRKRILIDITGFVGPYVLILAAILQRLGVAQCDVVYGEPVRYLHGERTKFTDEAVLEVKQVPGFEGVHTIDTSNDLLVIGVGYDFRLVAEVANDKEHARKVQLFGLPSVRPDMYQENLLQASQAREAVGPDASFPANYKYAPAYDPFVTASVLSTLVQAHRTSYPKANVYLSPLSTKAQTLGFAVFYLRECTDTATSVVLPFCKTYMKETSEGLSGVWLYRLELANLRAPATAHV
ncbi:MAG: hypothetical protein ACYDAB_03560 [bacterium]